MEKTLTPRMTLDHIIKERYPTFVDALRDLDDCLSMLYLFANLPQTDTVPPKTIQLCQRLCLEFEHYLIRTNSLRKTFLSIKGIYYQATIQGQDILWLVPYKFVQRVTGDVDFRIMGTFVEFYTTLLGFVNYRLYTTIGLVYPPKFDAKSDEQGAELAAFTLEGRNQSSIAAAAAAAAPQQDEPQKQISEKAQAEADKLLAAPASANEEPPSSYATAVENPSSSAANDDQDQPETTADGLDTFVPLDPDSADVLAQPTGLSASTAGTLFHEMTFFLSRETPRAPLEFILRAFGCKRIGWDAILGSGAFTSDEADRRITHQIVDRPNLPLPQIPTEDDDAASANASKRLRPGERVPGRVYVQPQWVWDCINAGRLLRTDLYAPGATLPPHLSPWVKAKKGEYDPTKPLAEQEGDGEAVIADGDISDEEMDDEEMEALEDAAAADANVDAEDTEDLTSRDTKDIASGEGMDIELANSDDDDEESESEQGEDFDGFDEEASDDDDDDDAAAARQHQRELEAEARGHAVGGKKDTSVKEQKKQEAELARKKRDRERKAKDEEVDRQKMMMSRRKRKTFEKMAYSNNKRDAEAEKLRAKRRKLEKAGGAGAAAGAKAQK